MNMSLEQWQKRLEGHFTQLASTRSNSTFPLFALEHGLSDDEFREIGSKLRERLSLGLRLESHWLLWVVYATELGYDYDGEEYWDSFEARTPRWRDRGSRDQLRTWFSRFRTNYHGVKPAGPWAEHFPIIAWPITHAILSKYLQWQFAKTLYDLRYRLASLQALSSDAVGQLLASNVWDASSRFREFLQQQELAGRIVLALLTDRKLDDQSPIYPATLQRLVSDLERVQSAREWLKETRRFVTDRMKGTGSGSGEILRTPELQPSALSDHVRDPLRIRPNLMLRRSGSSTWSVVVDIPSFASVARLHPELWTFLASTRCKISGATDTWLPGGWLLSSAQRRVLKSWPGAGIPLVKFERTNEILDHYLDRETRLSSGQVWLFRIGPDGLAREIAGRIVRPGREYVVLGDSELLADHPLFAQCGLECSGISAAVLSAPDTFSLGDITELQRFGLHAARTVRVWPAGLAGRAWDGEGHSEWLTTEAPCFGMTHDHPLDAYSLRLNNGAETLIEATQVGAPVFARISPLPVGTHTLSIKALRDSTGTSSTAAEGIVTLEVREPEPWIPGTTLHPGLVISVDPSDPSLDMFWEGDVGVNILGPPGRQVTCALSLARQNGRELMAEQIGTFDLPVTAEYWHSKFSDFVNVEHRTWTYLEAASGRFLVKGDELGDYALRLERDVKPIRLVCRSVNRVMTARLIDDTGKDDAATSRFFTFRRPAESITLNPDTMLTGFQIPSPGGLFEARHEEHLDTMIVSMPHIEGGFQGLVVEPDLRDLDGDTDQVAHILELMLLWTEARLFGPLVGMRRRRIIERLANRLFSRLCGRRWAEAESAYLSSAHSESELRQLERSVGGSPGFAVVLRRDYPKIDADTKSGSQWYAEVATRYHICSETGLCEFALQLASRPHHMFLLPKPILAGLLADVSEKTILLRGARLLAVLSATNNPASTCAALPRWKWTS
jgi:hypothetical protein